jgi:hypothetical protein
MGRPECCFDLGCVEQAASPKRRTPNRASRSL